MNMPEESLKIIIGQHEEIKNLLSEQKPKLGFWHINAGHILPIAIAVIGGIGLFYRFDNRVFNVEKAQIQIATMVETMDEKGTHASQRLIYQENELSKSTERRATELERRVTDQDKIIRDSYARLERIAIIAELLYKKANADGGDAMDGKKE